MNTVLTQIHVAGTNVRQADNQGYSPLHLARSKLKLLQRDNSSSSFDIKKQVYQVQKVWSWEGTSCGSEMMMPM